MTRLLLFKTLPGYTIDRHGIWHRNETIVDIVEIPESEVGEWTAIFSSSMAREGFTGEIRVERIQ